MSKTKLKDGYTRIAHKILEAITAADLTRNEMKVFFAIVRLSYGWKSKDTGKRAGVKNLTAMTGIGKSQGNYIYVAIKKLVDKNIVLKAKNKDKSNVYKINSDIETWKIDIPKKNIDWVLKISTDEPTKFECVSSTKNNTSIHTKPNTSIHTKPNTSIHTKPLEVKPHSNGEQQGDSGGSIDNSKDNSKEKVIAKIDPKPPLKKWKHTEVLEALGRPETSMLNAIEIEVSKALQESNCTLEDIKKARIRRNKNRLDWIQDNVCEERDKRLAGKTRLNEHGLPVFPNGQLDYNNLNDEQLQIAVMKGYYN